MTGVQALVVLVVSQLAGAAALALWIEVRITGRTARTGRAVLLHLAAAFGFLSASPLLIQAAATGDSAGRDALALLALFLPALVYSLLASLWALGYLRASLDAARG